MAENESASVIRAVVFDMDGLMFNTEDIYDQVGQRVLSKRGHDFTSELKQKMMGLRSDEAIRVMVEHCGLSDPATLLEAECHREFAELLPDQIQMMPGLAELLQRLESLNLPKAVATSSAPQFAEMALGRFSLRPRFQFVLTSDDVQIGKPDPEIYLLAAEKLGLAPAQMLVLEDSFTGSQAGVAAGAQVVAVPNAHTQSMDFGHCHHVADSLADPLIGRLIEGDRH